MRQIEQQIGRFYQTAGGTLLLLMQSVREFRLGRNDRRRILEQMLIVGWQTVPLALLIGIFTGMTVALGTGLVLAGFGQQVFIASIVAESMVKEMGPVFTAYIIAARVGAAMTAELGTMAVNDEINVLRVLGISPQRYLVMPRVIAALTMTPALTAYAMAVGLIGGYVVAGPYFGVSWVLYKAELFRVLTPDEVFLGLSKGLFFGAIYSAVCCQLGITTTGGAKGVGRSTTAAVVISLSGILIANFLLTRFMFG